MLPFSLDVCIFHFYSVSAVFILESNDVNVYFHASSIFQWFCEVLIDSLEKLKFLILPYTPVYRALPVKMIQCSCKRLYSGIILLLVRFSIRRL